MLLIAYRFAKGSRCRVIPFYVVVSDDIYWFNDWEKNVARMLGIWLGTMPLKILGHLLPTIDDTESDGGEEEEEEEEDDDDGE